MRKREEIEEALRLLLASSKALQAIEANTDHNPELCVVIGEFHALCWVLKCQTPHADPKDFDEMLNDIRGELGMPGKAVAP